MLKVGIIDKRPGKGGEVLYCDDFDEAVETIQSLKLSLKSDEAQALIFLSVLYFSWEKKFQVLKQLLVLGIVVLILKFMLPRGCIDESAYIYPVGGRYRVLPRVP